MGTRQISRGTPELSPTTHTRPLPHVKSTTPYISFASWMQDSLSRLITTNPGTQDLRGEGQDSIEAAAAKAIQDQTSRHTGVKETL
jgi:hypothetical protein